MPATNVASCLLLLLRSLEDLPRSCSAVRNFLRSGDPPQPTGHAHVHGLVGLWIDPTMVDVPPARLKAMSVAGAPGFRIRESVGINGTWSLCWLEPDDETASLDRAALREILAAALTERRSTHAIRRTAWFIPVFAADNGRESALLHAERLKNLFPGFIGEPMAWTRETGTLSRLAGNGEPCRSA